MPSRKWNGKPRYSANSRVLRIVSNTGMTISITINSQNKNSTLNIPITSPKIGRFVTKFPYIIDMQLMSISKKCDFSFDMIIE